MDDLDPTRPVFGITTAAELAGLNPQTLRLYETKGIVVPARTDGGTRRYSTEDVRRLGRVADLLGEGLNLAGVGAVMRLQDRNDDLESRNDALTSDNKALRRSIRSNDRRTPG